MSPNPLFLRKTVAEKMLMVEGDSMVKFEALALLLIKGFSWAVMLSDYTGLNPRPLFYLCSEIEA